MMGVLSQDQGYVLFDGVYLDSKFRSLINYLKNNGYTKKAQVGNVSLLSYVRETEGLSAKEAGLFIREFRTIIEFSDVISKPIKKWNDAIGKIVPIYKLFDDQLRSACHSHNINTLCDLLNLSDNDISIFFSRFSQLKDFTKIVSRLPVTGLCISDPSVNILNRNGIQTVEQLAFAGHSYLSKLPGTDGQFMNEILDSLSRLTETVTRYRKILLYKGKTQEINRTKPRVGSPTTPTKSHISRIQFPVSFDNAGYILYVFKSNAPCQWQGHEIESATGILVSLDGKGIKININHCKTCDMCFIDYYDYKKYRETYGPLMGNISFSEEIFPKGKGFANLSDESILHLCGYTVKKQANLSENERHYILGNIMDHNILKKNEIMDYLKLFIKSRKNIPNMQDAVQKWEDDLDWVEYYRIDKQRKYIIKEINKI